MREQRFCQIDKDGCIACGGQTFERRAVINDELASSWGLSVSERADFDEREGHACSSCQMSKRVRMLLWSIRKLFLPSNLRVLHFNQINHLAPTLQTLGDITETCFQQELERGRAVGGLVNQDICELTFPNNHFDVALHSETLEHLLDFDKGLTEVTRVLKPGGLQIYTVPLRHGQMTRRRMQQEDGRLVQLLPASYHGNEGEFPVVWEFGSDFFDQRKAKISELHYDDYSRNKTVFTVIERKP